MTVTLAAVDTDAAFTAATEALAARQAARAEAERQDGLFRDAVNDMYQAGEPATSISLRLINWLFDQRNVPIKGQGVGIENIKKMVRPRG